MLSLLFVLHSLHAEPRSTSRCMHLDGSISIMNPTEDGLYGYTYDDENVLCQRFGQDRALQVETKTALWGAYESVHLFASGELATPTTALTVAKRLFCASMYMFGVR